MAVVDPRRRPRAFPPKWAVRDPPRIPPRLRLRPPRRPNPFAILILVLVPLQRVLLLHLLVVAVCLRRCSINSNNSQPIMVGRIRGVLQDAAAHRRAEDMVATIQQDKDEEDPLRRFLFRAHLRHSSNSSNNTDRLDRPRQDIMIHAMEIRIPLLTTVAVAVEGVLLLLVVEEAMMDLSDRMEDRYQGMACLLLGMRMGTIRISSMLVAVVDLLLLLVVAEIVHHRRPTVDNSILEQVAAVAVATVEAGTGRVHHNHREQLMGVVRLVLVLTMENNTVDNRYRRRMISVAAVVVHLLRTHSIHHSMVVHHRRRHEAEDLLLLVAIPVIIINIHIRRIVINGILVVVDLLHHTIEDILHRILVVVDLHRVVGLLPAIPIIFDSIILLIFSLLHNIKNSKTKVVIPM